ncbi:hypothetical protein BKG80_06650 [Mycobacteroides chelonae]|jgi:hypothetical protein|uniref:hypothetical protein n=1 Tax=Mycobacteroides TaxID=670516 RepID=UPI000713A6F8|nr:MULTISPECIES: hypothetical protein [Mycobacteroides]KRQ28148.1 hypothetical protein AOT86_09705 [Mycobacteroides sp. H072]KRQ34093.1 hypothetical protein AOT84_19380 [Mycobacteroides sp. H002]KRQ53752.1 hypothetical protein AOT85_06810 [Mycobacteroides sp. H054]KRQ66650.1 hypothetical protein AOT83_22285 [Mycobacteroides sp. H001]MBF9350289.1 hypothetical protein [Mycobacteroides chelonae]
MGGATEPQELGIDESPGKSVRPATAVMIGFTGAIVIAAIGIGAFMLYSHLTTPRSFTINGSITIYDDNVSVPPGSSCRGIGGYRDIGPGTAVTVSDESGTLLAKSQLQSGTSAQGTCSLPFEIPDVPTGKKFYKVEASHRGEVNYTESEARRGITLQIGQDADRSNPTVSSRPPSTTTTAPAPLATPLYPGASGMVYISTKSGATRCQISEFEVDCQSRFQNAPHVDGYPANGIRFTSSGTRQWVSGDLGDIHPVTLDYSTYSAMSWTIEATASGTTFTNTTTGHGVFVSVEKVSSW